MLDNSLKLSRNGTAPVIFGCLLLLLSPVNGQIGFNSLYSVSHNIFGLNMYNVGDSKMDLGYYFEVKGLLSNPKTRKSRETTVYASAGLVMQMGPAAIIYLGAGPSWRGYYEGGVGSSAADAPRTNITGGVIVTNQGSSPLLHRLSYQVGIDTQPFGLNVGFGFHFNLPFQNRSK